MTVSSAPTSSKQRLRIHSSTRRLSPKPEDIDLDGSGVTIETLKELLTLDAKSWRENCAGIREYFEQFGDKLPHELREELEALEKAFAE